MRPLMGSSTSSTSTRSSSLTRATPLSCRTARRRSLTAWARSSPLPLLAVRALVLARRLRVASSMRVSTITGVDTSVLTRAVF